MARITIKCGCGERIPAPVRSQVAVRCPECGKRIVYLAPERDKAAARGGKWADLDPDRRVTRGEHAHSRSVSNAVFAYTYQTISQHRFRIAYGVIIASLLGTVLYFVGQGISKSQWQLDYEFAEERLKVGDFRAARPVLQKIVLEAPEGIWARKARNSLAALPAGDGWYRPPAAYSEREERLAAQDEEGESETPPDEPPAKAEVEF